jgi:GNAT superfamily N-acetyltransferase
MSRGAGGLRRAGSGDRDALVGLFADLLAHHAALEAAFALRPDARERLPGLVAHLLRDPAAAVFVWVDADEVCGFCSVRVTPAPEAMVEASRAEVEELGVRSERRRKGIGRALVAAASAWAKSRGAARIEVRVAVRNPEGQAFWRALGYGGFVEILQRRL